MNALYKRIVTVGMISLTSILAWVYCIMEYRDKPAYIMTVSAVLVVSVYALLNTAMSLHNTKEEKLKEYIDRTVESSFAALASGNAANEKLTKASYVQLRKTATCLTRMEAANELTAEHMESVIREVTEASNHTVTQSVNKAIKAFLKYSEQNNNNLLASLTKLSDDIAKMSEIISRCSDAEQAVFAEALGNLTEDITSIRNRVISVSNKLSELSSVSVEPDKDPLDIFDEHTEGNESDEAGNPLKADEAAEDTKNIDVADNTGDNGSASVADSTKIDESADIAKAVVIDEPDISVDTQEANLDTPEVESFFNQFEDNKKTEDNAEESDRMLSQDDIAALFAESQERYRANSDDDFSILEHPEAMDQSLIDALLDSEADQDSDLADVIPFPTAAPAEAPAEAQESEPVADTPVNDDPNRQLSPEEIAALFASAMPTDDEAADSTPSESEASDETASDSITTDVQAEPETAVAPVNDDPNRQLSPEEIAALFASMQ